MAARKVIIAKWRTTTKICGISAFMSFCVGTPAPVTDSRRATAGTSGFLTFWSFEQGHGRLPSQAGREFEDRCGTRCPDLSKVV
jgi:hypothetical protein